MPLPADEKLIALGEDLLKQFDEMFGLHPGFRPAHARGILVEGSFRASAQARTLSRAPQLNRESTPVSVRFSNSTGLPEIPDTDPNANPRGMAIRFHLAEHVHTDIVSHSTDGFPTRTGQEFLEFLRAAAASSAPGASKSPSPIEKFLGEHPKALAFVQTPKPFPSSFAREKFFGVTAMRFLNQVGGERYGRYRIVPEAGTMYLDEAAVAQKSDSYLFDELKGRIGKSAIRFTVGVQVAKDGDVTDDATEHWPEERETLELGTISLEKIAEDNAKEQKQIIFDPIPRVDGLEPSGDPLLELRAAIYLLSGRRRRKA